MGRRQGGPLAEPHVRLRVPGGANGPDSLGDGGTHADETAVKHDRAGEVANAVMACWSADGTGDIGTAAEDERQGWKPTEMAQDEGDQWHISGTKVFDENAHWGVPAAEVPDGDEPHEQGHIRAPSGAVPYDKDWDGVGRATNKVTASLRLLRRVRSMVDTSRWWTMKWPVAAVGFLTTAMGATPGAVRKATWNWRWYIRPKVGACTSGLLVHGK